MKATVILISGKQGSGKTTLSNSLQKVICEQSQDWCEKVRFSEVIYELHNKIYVHMRRYGIKIKGKKDGPLLQLLGTEWGRKVHGDDIWIKTTKAKIKELEITHNLTKPEKRLFVIIEDCRMKDEFNAFPDAWKIRLECDEEERKERCSMWRENNTHKSEIDLDEYSAKGKFDLYVNTGELTKEESLQRVLKRFAGESD